MDSFRDRRDAIMVVQDDTAHKLVAGGLWTGVQKGPR
jgi:hypothetical protein